MTDYLSAKQYPENKIVQTVHTIQSAWKSVNMTCQSLQNRLILITIHTSPQNTQKQSLCYQIRLFSN